MKVEGFMFVVVMAVFLAALALPATASQSGDIVVKDIGNTAPVDCSSDGCGCCNEGKNLGDLFLFGVALMGIAALKATQK